MMKYRNLIPIGRQSLVLAFVVICVCALEPAYCQEGDIALLLQKTPAGAGVVNIGTGIHHFNVDTEVTLKATPKSGYQFAYWLGDVSDPTANNTMVYMDAPKIIIAVFERVKYDFPVFEEPMPDNAPWGGLMGHAADYGKSGGSGGGGKRPRKWPPWPPWEPPEPPSDDFPVPNDINDFPVPIPEPATGMLLAVGSLAILSRRRTKNRRKPE